MTMRIFTRGGEAEAVFGEAAADIPREKMIIQTKCAIHPGTSYDFSKEHILKSVEGSLKRLKTDYVDVLLLHRPDTLMEPEEVAEAFETLEKQGKVRYFGVSNENAMQMELLNHYCGGRIVADQLQFSIAHCDIIDSGLNVNVHNDAGTNRDGGVLEYCRLKNITIQAWSPFQYGMFEGVFLGSEKFPELNKLIGELAEKYQVTDNAIAGGMDSPASGADSGRLWEVPTRRGGRYLQGLRCETYQGRMVRAVYGGRKNSCRETETQGENWRRLERF